MASPTWVVSLSELWEMVRRIGKPGKLLIYGVAKSRTRRRATEQMGVLCRKASGLPGALVPRSALGYLHSVYTPLWCNLPCSGS